MPRKLQRWVLPVYAAIGMALIVGWLGWAVTLVKGGWAHVTPGEAFIFAGFAGIAALGVFSTCVTVVVMESVLYEARTMLNAELLEIIQRIAAPTATEPPDGP